jgi:hypothetical protein
VEAIGLQKPETGSGVSYKAHNIARMAGWQARERWSEEAIEAGWHGKLHLPRSGKPTAEWAKREAALHPPKE